MRSYTPVPHVACIVLAGQLYFFALESNDINMVTSSAVTLAA
jgi:hypothetical protein